MIAISSALYIQKGFKPYKGVSSNCVCDTKKTGSVVSNPIREYLQIKLEEDLTKELKCFKPYKGSIFKSGFAVVCGDETIEFQTL